MRLSKFLYATLGLVTVVLFRGGATEGFFENVASFASQVGGVMDVVISRAEHVVSTIQDWESVIYEAIEEDCDFVCENGAEPRLNPAFVMPEPNGCGSLGLKFNRDALPLEDLSNCCDRHDTCYDTCNNQKDECDQRFKNCLYHICDRYKTKIGEMHLKKCKGAAKFMFTGTVALGCKSYKNAQSKACLCENLTHPDL